MGLLSGMTKGGADERESHRSDVVGWGGGVQVNNGRRGWGLRAAVWKGLRCLREESEREMRFVVETWERKVQIQNTFVQFAGNLTMCTTQWSTRGSHKKVSFCEFLGKNQKWVSLPNKGRSVLGIFKLWEMSDRVISDEWWDLSVEWWVNYHSATKQGLSGLLQTRVFIKLTLKGLSLRTKLVLGWAWWLGIQQDWLLVLLVKRSDSLVQWWWWRP